MPFEQFLVYVTGGVAFGDVKASGIAGLSSKTNTEVGYAVGGGIEGNFSPNMSAKLEYLFVDLGNMNCPVANCGGGATAKVKMETHIVRGGINFHF